MSSVAAVDGAAAGGASAPSRVVVHVDGSAVPVPLRTEQFKKYCSLGWGLVSQFDDRHHEAHGHLLVGLPSQLMAMHEQFAFVQAVSHVHQLGVAFSEATIFCDDDIFGYAQFFLHGPNYRQDRANQVLDRLRLVAKVLRQHDLVDLTLQAFAEARVVKLVGHNQDVYQERSDYLAKFGAHTGRVQALLAAGLAAEQPEFREYDAWLHDGFVGYDPELDEARREYPAFCGPRV